MLLLILSRRPSVVRSARRSGHPLRAALLTPRPQHRVHPGPAVRMEERLESPATRHGEDAIFESHHPSQRFVNVLSQYRWAPYCLRQSRTLPWGRYQAR